MPLSSNIFVIFTILTLSQPRGSDWPFSDSVYSQSVQSNLDLHSPLGTYFVLTDKSKKKHRCFSFLLMTCNIHLKTWNVSHCVSPGFVWFWKGSIVNSSLPSLWRFVPMLIFRFGLHLPFIQSLQPSVLNEYWRLPPPFQTALNGNISIYC